VFRTRRALALLLHLLLVLAILPGGRMACAPAAPAAGAAEHAHHGGQAPTQSSDVATHCATAVGCGVIVADVEALLLATTVAVTTSGRPASATLPASPRAAPEPPPPRG
jgi:hypothetical protein